MELRNKMFEKVKYKISFYGFFVLVFLIRLPLIFRGHLYWPDEKRSILSLMSWESFLNHDFNSAVFHWFSASARPVFIIFGLIPAAIQHVFKARFFKSADLSYVQAKATDFLTVDPHFFDIPAFFNLLATIAILVVLHHIFKKFLSRNMSFVGIFVYALLCSSNFYISHLVPYYYSLFFFLLGIFFVLSKGSIKNSFFAGLFTILGFGFYPGYYLLIFVAFALFIVEHFKKDKFYLRLLVFLLSMVMVVGTLEIVSRCVSSSYLQHCLNLSTSVTQGSFDEGFVFIFKYLFDVEKITGIIVLVFFVISLFFVWRPKEKRSLRCLLWSIFACYLFFAVNSFFLRRWFFMVV